MEENQNGGPNHLSEPFVMRLIDCPRGIVKIEIRADILATIGKRLRDMSAEVVLARQNASKRGLPFSDKLERKWEAAAELGRNLCDAGDMIFGKIAVAGRKAMIADTIIDLDGQTIGDYEDDEDYA